MIRHRLILLVLVLLVVPPLLAQKEPFDVRILAQRDRVLKRLRRPFLVPNLVATRSLGVCEQKGDPDSGDPGVGGFACDFIYLIDVKVSRTNVVSMDDLVTVRPGDCVRWKIIKEDGDNRAAGITMLNFLDTPEEAVAAGKPATTVSSHPIDLKLCTRGDPYCYLFVALAGGTYRYQLQLSIDGTSVVIDPDLEVTCSGPGCGDPDDLEP